MYFGGLGQRLAALMLSTPVHPLPDALALFSHQKLVMQRSPSTLRNVVGSQH